jgi:ribosomal protein S27E
MEETVIAKSRYEANCPECGELYIYEEDDFWKGGCRGFLNQRCDHCQRYFTVLFS